MVMIMIVYHSFFSYSIQPLRPTKQPTNFLLSLFFI